MNSSSPPRSPGPVHLVFGATGGIGSELGRTLARRGSTLILAGRHRDRVDALAAEIGGEPQVVDVLDPDQTETFFTDVVRRHGRIDGVAHCVGSVLLKPAHRTTLAEWSETLAVNLTTAFCVVRAGAKVMSSGGSIVLVSSAAARAGLPGHEAIAAAKAGVIGLTLSAAASYASKGLRINCVAPGLVRTPLTRGITSQEVSLKASLAMHALGRLGEPADVANLIAWLLGEESGWVTGQVFGVDGGLATVRTRVSA